MKRPKESSQTDEPTATDLRQWVMMQQIKYKHWLRILLNDDPDVLIDTSAGNSSTVENDSRKHANPQPQSPRFGRVDMAAMHDMRFHGGGDHSNV